MSSSHAFDLLPMAWNSSLSPSPKPMRLFYSRLVPSIIPISTPSNRPGGFVPDCPRNRFNQAGNRFLVSLKGLQIQAPVCVPHRSLNWFHGIDSLWEIDSLWNWFLEASIPCENSIPLSNAFLEASIPCEGIEGFRIVTSPSFAVCGGKTGFPALKINIDGTWPTRFHTWFLLNSRNRSPPSHNLSKIPV